ncbi:ABC transporter ATP-binding protein [Lactococcus termiticola]|uniref:ABC transporter ATP-binding protein n=1 Tax=Lactococcus termiticola TaxID=2169526 RepID=A0A2R5HHP3_9LACT|nr:ABC transporter ATP-binding protein [Lactococcus termiticola]GBG97502.1 ABC transporter ATP-binding protein [Lactococcus termiticola]
MGIKVEKLHFNYGKQAVLRIVSAKFEAGKIYGIVGKNGVGKTTFFKTMTNIITNYSGQVFIDGQEVKKNPSVLSKIGITLDDMELYKNFSGLFNIRYFGGLRGSLNEAKALEMAKHLSIADALDKKVSSYSLGMGKKLILLISLMNDAEVLIFDEPFRGIDAASVAWLRDYLLELKKKGKMILISSHVQEDIESICDEVLPLYEGDFQESFDLTDAERELSYSVVVDDIEKLQTLLSSMGIDARLEDNKVKFDANTASFQELFKKAAADGLLFDEIKKESKFADFVK